MRCKAVHKGRKFYYKAPLSHCGTGHSRRWYWCIDFKVCWWKALAYRLGEISLWRERGKRLNWLLDWLVLGPPWPSTQGGERSQCEGFRSIQNHFATPHVHTPLASRMRLSRSLMCVNGEYARMCACMQRPFTSRLTAIYYSKNTREQNTRAADNTNASWQRTVYLKGGFSAGLVVVVVVQRPSHLDSSQAGWVKQVKVEMRMVKATGVGQSRKKKKKKDISQYTRLSY